MEPAGILHPTRTRSPIVAYVALGAAGLLAAAWFWTRLCQFPTQPWNDVRLAAAVAAARDLPVYATADTGSVNTWTYGPLPLLFFRPAAWASSAGDALFAAGVLNLLLIVLPVVLVSRSWLDASQRPAGAAFAAILLCLALWPDIHYDTLWSDNLAIACGLIGNLLLLRARSSAMLWTAAVFSTATLACKQTALGIPLAQICWLVVTAGWTAGARHILRCAVAGLVIGLACIAEFGWPGLRFTLLELPSQFPWTNEPLERLQENGLALLLHVVLPAAIMWRWRQAFREPSLLLPALAWACTLPLGLMALLKIGGRMNSVHGFMLWLPPVLAVVFSRFYRFDLYRPAKLLTAAVIVGIFGYRVAQTPRLIVKPALHFHAEAAALAHQFQGHIWFPWSPLSTLYSEQRYFHDEDGLHVRLLTRIAIPPEQLASQLPPALGVIAMRQDMSDWGIGFRLLGEHPRKTPSGKWLLLTAESPP